MARLFRVSSVEVDTVWGLTREAQTAMSKDDLAAVMQRLRPAKHGRSSYFLAAGGPCIDGASWVGTWSGAGHSGAARWRGRYVGRLLHDAFVSPVPAGSVLRHLVTGNRSSPCCCAAPHHAVVGSVRSVEPAWTSDHGYEANASASSEALAFIQEEHLVALWHDFPQLQSDAARRRAYLSASRETLRRLGNATDLGYATIKRYLRSTPHCELKACNAHRLARRLHVTAYNVCRQGGLTECRLVKGTPMFYSALQAIGATPSPVSMWAAVLRRLRATMRATFHGSAHPSTWNDAAVLAAAMAFVRSEGERLVEVLRSAWWPANREAVGRAAASERRVIAARRKRHTDQQRDRRKRRALQTR